MSPEQARGEVLDARADVFAAGIISWELLAGRKLYRGGDLIEQARAANVPELPSRGLPDETKLHAIVSRALAPNRDDRYASAGEMHADLLAWAAAAKLLANPIRLGEWLQEHFGEELVAQRRARESAAKSLDPSPKPARALLTPEPPRISYKDEPAPESLAPVDTSPPSKRADAPPAPSPRRLVFVFAILVVGVLAWLIISHH
jgi:serine/threonine-protein kinase